MLNREKKLNEMSNQLIELREYDLAKIILDKLETNDPEINDEKLFKLALLELELNGAESAHKYVFANKHNFNKQTYFYSALQKLNFKYYCPVKRIFVDRFYPLPQMYEEKFREHKSDIQLTDFETLNIAEYLCRESGSNDRDRLYAMFLDKMNKETPIGAKFKILDFSPSKPFENYMRWNKSYEYTTADFLLDGYDMKLDVQNMHQIADESFDGVICSHVLEHVPNDIVAMSEIYRILKKGGWAIMMVPIHLGRTFIDEDFSITDIAERWRRFGQDDHLRVYSKQGFMHRVRESGFRLMELGSNYFGEFEMQKNGITKQSILYLGIK
jgi:SAM-dependent methyltransferase